MLDSTAYNPDATHLLIGKAPSRSEKLLAFIAAGKWVLHIKYLLESGKQGKFVKVGHCFLTITPTFGSLMSLT